MRRSNPTHWTVAAVTLAALAASPARAQIETQDLASGLTPADLAQELAGSGVTISNVSYQGSDRSAGTFSGGETPIGFDAGVILSSGDIVHVKGPNQSDGITDVTGLSGDADLDVLSGYPTFDATILEFDFVPQGPQVGFLYVFASDEYNEYVHSSFNDVFAFFVNGVNCAVVPETMEPVSINTINNGNPHDTDPRENPELYRNNDLDDEGGSIDTEMDGLTVTLSCIADAVPGETNHMKLAIADASDQILDSNVFLKRQSLVSCAETGIPALDETPLEGIASKTIHETAEPAAAALDPQIAQLLHDLNCDVVVPVEQGLPLPPAP